jgi:hypothetical protein
MKKYYIDIALGIPNLHDDVVMILGLASDISIASEYEQQDEKECSDTGSYPESRAIEYRQVDAP